MLRLDSRLSCLILTWKSRGNHSRASSQLCCGSEIRRACPLDYFEDRWLCSGYVEVPVLSIRSKLLKKCQIRLTVSTTRPSVREGPVRNSWGARKVLESLPERVATAHESRQCAEKAIAVAEFAFASPREPPDKMSPGQDALENANECPSDLDTRVQEREAMPRRVSKCDIVAVTSRFAIF